MQVSKNKPLRFGLYGEDDFLLPDFMHCETIEYRSRKNNWVIKPHVHANLFQIFLIHSGKLCFIFEETRHLIREKAIVTIPENTLHGLEVSENIKGMVLTLSSSFPETVFKSTPEILLELGSTRILKNFRNRKIFDVAWQMVQGLHNEMQEELPAKGMIMQSYFKMLLGEIYRMSLEETGKTVTSDTRNTRYFRAFQKSVRQSLTPMKSINEYARELNITPVHLNRICQSTAGKTALYVVHSFLFLEAEKYLKHTEYSVSEIAYRLNFDDPAYFSRFFRKFSGLSPKQYKEKN